MTTENEYRVGLVLDRSFKGNLSELSKRIHLWVCDTPDNRIAIKAVWNNSKEYSTEFGVTSFRVEESDDIHDMAERVINQIWEHHGEPSREVPMNVLEVYGANLSPEIKEVLSANGFERFERTEYGFCAFWG